MAFVNANTGDLRRANLWSTQLKEVLTAEMMGTKYVRMITDFPDGDTLNIPSIGLAEVHDYTENTPIRYSAMDTGNFTFTITDYKNTGMYITKKVKQDSYLYNQLVATFVPEQRRALMAAIENSIMKSVTPAATGGQTTASTNTINGAEHRWVGAGTNETLSITDFIKARYALQMANVGDQNLVAIVHPSCEFALNSMTNLVNVSNNPRWEGIIESGLARGMSFVKNIYGFDVYTSQFLYQNTASETIGTRTAAAGVNNLFFSAQSNLLPIVGQIRQAPEVDFEYNKDLQRDEYVTTCRYGFKFFRPENMAIVLTDTDQVS